MLRVAITRAQPEADRTAERVRARGAEAIVAPLLTIVPCGYDTSTSGAQAIIFTSTNGVRAFPDARGARERLVLAVGDATANAAREAGFVNVRSADGDANALVDLAKRELDPANGKLVHVSGDHVGGDVSGKLRAAGFSVDWRLAYASIAAMVLPDALLGPLDVVLFHSTRAAETFAALDAPNVEERTAGCLRESVAHAAAKSSCKRINTARYPREYELLKSTRDS